MNAAVQLKKWRIKYVLGRTEKLIRTCTSDRRLIKQRMPIAAALPFYVKVWCEMPWVGICASTLLGATKEEVLGKTVAHVEKYHFGKN
jgi:hypothetical protein